MTRKITLAAARIKLGLQEKLMLGNLDAKRDWGYAPEYVEGMWRILQADTPDDFVLATGETHRVREFAALAFGQLDMDLAWCGEGEHETGVDRKTGKTLLAVDPRYYRPTEVDILIGDSSKAREKLGWAPKTSFEELVRIMAEADFNRVKRRGY